MVRFREIFEVKNEINDDHKIDTDYYETGGSASIFTQEETQRESNKIGGFDDYEDVDDFNAYENIEQERYEG